MKRFIKLGILLLVGVGVVLVIVYAGGFMGEEKIRPDQVVTEDTLKETPVVTGQAGVETITDEYEAVGTVRPRTETTIESQVTGRVLDIRVNAGDMVQEGDLLITLDARELIARNERAVEGLKSAQARQGQAGQVISAAEAEFVRAKADYERFRELYSTMAATIQQKQQAEAAYLQARANLEQSRQGLIEAKALVRQAGKQVEEAEVALSYTELAALGPAQVVKRLAEPGDTAWPGKPLLVLQAGEALRMEALVREGLIDKVRPGTQVKVVIDSLDKTLKGKVEELVPSADPKTRTFLVKIIIDQVEGLMPGMFGRLLVPVGRREVVVAPAQSIRRVGQLETVTIEDNGKWREIFVRTGRVIGDKIEVLSGLGGSETLALITSGVHQTPLMDD